MVARAPGRLDVMGGIADYSGSLVLQAGGQGEDGTARERLPFCCVDTCQAGALNIQPGVSNTHRRLGRQQVIQPPFLPFFGTSALQMPLAEACHVAVQRHAPAATPLLRIVSFRHGTAFELPLSELVSWRAAVRHISRVVCCYPDWLSLLCSAGHAGGRAASQATVLRLPLGSGFPGVPELLCAAGSAAYLLDTIPASECTCRRLLQAPVGEPISYEAAKALFRRDPSHAWAAYVGGALVVLMRERGARFDRGLSILVSSGAWQATLGCTCMQPCSACWGCARGIKLACGAGRCPAHFSVGQTGSSPAPACLPFGTPQILLSC